MIKRLVYNNKPFKILDGFEIKQSNAEVTFNDITIDFTGYSLLDIPFKFQEIKIMQAETEEDILFGKVIFTGFLDDINLSEMKNREDEQRELTLTLLSPLAMTTKRYVSLIGTFSKEEAVKRILQPLLDDGFKIVELNVPDGQITTNYVIESVENCMNDICFKTGVFWFIDEKKDIYINNIDYLFGIGSKKIISKKDEIRGLSKIQPKIENTDYANVINFKNVRVYYSTLSICDELGELIEEHDYPILKLPKKIKKGDTVQFNNPIVIGENILRDLKKEGEINDANLSSLSLVIDGEEFFIKIDTNQKSPTYNQYITSNNFNFSDDGGEEKVLVLQRDNFFNNLITGFKWNGSDGAIIYSFYTGSALRYTTMRFMYSSEINRLKGTISDTGIVEKCIDFKEKWTTPTQLIDYARSLIASNEKNINQVDLTFDESPNLKIGDIVEIHEPDFFIEGKFAVKEITYKYINDEDEEWNLKVKSSDFNSSYIDLFRPAQKQENESKIDNIILGEYIEENVYEKHEIGQEQSLTGDVIIIKDCDGLISVEKVYGDQTQKTTSGKNIFNLKVTTKTYENDITFSQVGVGRVKLNGSSNGKAMAIRFDELGDFEEGKKYTVRVEKISGTSTKASPGLVWSTLFYPEHSSAGYVRIEPNTSVATLTFTATANTGREKPYFWIGWDDNSVLGESSVFNNLVLEISITEGTKVEDYEPYTGGKPSPSFDYPQEIENTKEEVTVTASNEDGNEKQNFVLPIQKEMLNGDYIDSVEHHGWGKQILNGSENWNLNASFANTFYNTASDTVFPGITSNKDSFVFISDKLIYGGLVTSSRDFKDGYMYGFVGGDGKVIKRINFKSTKFNTVDELKNYLDSNPITIYYKLAEPYDLELSDEQKEVIEKLHRIQSYPETILTVDNLARITASYTKKGESNEN